MTYTKFSPFWSLKWIEEELKVDSAMIVTEDLIKLKEFISSFNKLIANELGKYAAKLTTLWKIDRVESLNAIKERINKSIETEIVFPKQSKDDVSHCKDSTFKHNEKAKLEFVDAKSNVLISKEAISYYVPHI